MLSNEKDMRLHRLITIVWQCFGLKGTSKMYYWLQPIPLQQTVACQLDLDETAAYVVLTLQHTVSWGRSSDGRALA